MKHFSTFREKKTSFFETKLIRREGRVVDGIGAVGVAFGGVHEGRREITGQSANESGGHVVHKDFLVTLTVTVSRPKTPQ